MGATIAARLVGQNLWIMNGPQPPSGPFVFRYFYHPLTGVLQQQLQFVLNYTNRFPYGLNVEPP